MHILCLCVPFTTLWIRIPLSLSVLKNWTVADSFFMRYLNHIPSTYSMPTMSRWFRLVLCHFHWRGSSLERRQQRDAEKEKNQAPIIKHFIAIMSILLMNLNTLYRRVELAYYIESMSRLIGGKVERRKTCLCREIDELKKRRINIPVNYISPELRFCGGVRHASRHLQLQHHKHRFDRLSPQVLFSRTVQKSSSDTSPTDNIIVVRWRKSLILI